MDGPDPGRRQVCRSQLPQFGTAPRRGVLLGGESEVLRPLEAIIFFLGERAVLAPSHDIHHLRHVLYNVKADVDDL